MKHIALTSSNITRDAQVYTGPEQYPSPIDEGWTDWNDAQIYIGVYEGSEIDARRRAAKFAGINPESVVLITTE